MKKFFSDFKKFITKGNILDLAIAVVIGGAFGKIVTSLVNDIIMPLITLAVGGVSVADWKWVITEAVYDTSGNIITAESALMYGNFIQSIFDFLIIAFFIFIALRVVIKLQGGLTKLNADFSMLNNKERKAFFKEQKALGKSKKEIAIMLEEREAALATEAKIAEEKKIAEEIANRPESTEAILKDIRKLLGGKAPKEEKK